MKATLQVLQALKAMGTTRGKKDPVVSFYTTNQSAIDKTIKQLKSGLPVEVTRMFIKMVADEFDLQVLIDRLSAAAVQERADLNVTSAQTYHSYAPGTFLNPAEAQAEELRDSYMLHRIIEAKADGYRLAGLGDLHRQRLQRVLEEMIPGIIVVSSDDFYLGQFRLHPDRD